MDEASEALFFQLPSATDALGPVWLSLCRIAV